MTGGDKIRIAEDYATSKEGILGEGYSVEGQRDGR